MATMSAISSSKPLQPLSLSHSKKLLLHPNMSSSLQFRHREANMPLSNSRKNLFSAGVQHLGKGCLASNVPGSSVRVPSARWHSEDSQGPVKPAFLILCVGAALLASSAAPAFGEMRERAEVVRRAYAYDPVSEDERAYSEAFASRVSRAIETLERGKEAQAEGKYAQALDLFSQVVEQNGDLALAAYARVGRAVMLYEVGDRTQAILEMEDMSLDLKGYPEVHAALAAALYTDKHALRPAEQQFTLATLLDKRYTNLEWVSETRHWPPSLLQSLQKFLYLQ